MFLLAALAAFFYLFREYPLNIVVFELSLPRLRSTLPNTARLCLKFFALSHLKPFSAHHDLPRIMAPSFTFSQKRCIIEIMKIKE